MQHKITSALIVTVITFLGFQALSVIIGLNQQQTFVSTAVYIFIFHIFWIAFVFDLQLKYRSSVGIVSAKFQNLVREALIVRFRHFFHWHYLRHYLNYLVLPTLLYWAVVILLFINPFAHQFKQAMIWSSTLVLTTFYWHMREHLTARIEMRYTALRILSALKLFAAYLVFAAAIGGVYYYGLDAHLLFYAIAGASFMLLHQALFQHDFGSPKLTLLILILSAIVAGVGVYISHIWNTEYFTAAMIVLAAYNTLWAFMHHTLDRTFSTKLAFEYLILAILVVSIIFATHNFSPRLG